RSNWAEWLSILAFAYNSSVHSSTSYSPNFLLFGYNPNLSAKFPEKESDPAGRPFLPSQRAEDFIAVLEEKREQARDALALAQERQAKAYNKNRRPEDVIEIGDQVLI
ncbi:hypothetical protein BDN70DRAFT_762322, partial [Pholiota conissans]